jgi:ADP-ribosylglycohydrolase
MSAQEPSPQSRARGALLGLAVGDAAGFPALFHRTVRLGRRRQALWRFADELDQQHVLRSMMPMAHGQPDALAVSATDDGEFAAVAALTLIEADGDYSSEALFAGWHKHVVQPGDDIWSGISERNSIVNARRGLRPPETGNDNPAHFDDGAVARAVPAGIRLAGQPERAAEVARTLAQITNAADGVWAAEAMAAAVSAAAGGAGPAEALEAGRLRIPADSWLGRQMATAMSLAVDAASAFDLAAALNDEVANWNYSFGAVAPETLASAFALTLASGGDPMTAIPAAATIAKQADSVPAMVGALTGALAGEDRLPATWRAKVATLRGVCVPALKGVSLADLADRLAGGE